MAGLNIGFVKKLSEMAHVGNKKHELYETAERLAMEAIFSFAKLSEDAQREPTVLSTGRSLGFSPMGQSPKRILTYKSSLGDGLTLTVTATQLVVSGTFSSTFRSDAARRCRVSCSEHLWSPAKWRQP